MPYIPNTEHPSNILYNQDGYNVYGYNRHGYNRQGVSAVNNMPHHLVRAQGKGAQGMVGPYRSSHPPGVVLEETNRMGPDGHWYRLNHEDGYWYDLNDGGISYFSRWPDAQEMVEYRQLFGRQSTNGSPNGGRAHTRNLYSKGKKGMPSGKGKGKGNGSTRKGSRGKGSRGNNF
jgi:hypothetical protein